MPPKKKLSKKEKQRIEAEQAEIARIEQEKERQRELEEEKERQELERAEAEKRQKQEITENKIRKVQLKESAVYFDRIKNQVDSIYKEFKVQREWERYMRCNGLPDAHDPSDLRKYIHVWCKNTMDSNTNEKNWLLEVDESSILTQNQTILNLTHPYLRSKLPNLGDIYSNRIKEVLGILNEIHESITEKNSLKKSIIEDLEELKTDFRNISSMHVDEFSFKILCNITRDMKLETPVIAVHLYESDVFKSQLWTEKNIPQPPLNPKEKLKEETRPLEVDFPTLGVLNFLLPPIVKCKYAAIRGLWTNYDHFSDYCPSFKHPYKSKPIDELRISTKKEWKKRMELLKATLDEEVLLKENNPTVNATSTNEEEPPPKKVIDIDKLYNEYEEEINKSERLKKSKEALNLAEFEVNLRSHRIVGGIFCLDYLEQPQQDTRINEDTFLRTLTYPYKLTRKPFFQPFRPPPPPLPGIRRLPEEIEAEIKFMEKNFDRLAQVTLQLTDKVLWFEPPIVCRWETDEETVISVNVDNEQKQQSTTKIQNDDEDDEDDTEKDDLSCKSKTKIIKSQQKKKKQKNIDFNLLDIPVNIDLHQLVKTFVVPRLPHGYCVKIEIPGNERKSSIMRYKKDGESSRKESLQDNIAQNFIPPGIESILYETKSPRTFFPHTTLKQKIKIIPEPNISSDDDEEKIKSKCGLTQNVTGTYTYMFSKFLKDLDQLIELQVPVFQDKIEEIIDNLTPPPDTPINSETDGRLSSISLLKDDFMMLRDPFFTNKSNEPKIIEPIESDESSIEDSVEEDEFSQDQPPKKHKGRWSIRDVHDSKYNEDKLTIQFRTGRLGYFGLAANRYSNLPYQTWELKPDMKTSGTVIFSMTAAVVSIELTITTEGICLNSMQGGPLTPLHNILGVTMSLQDLITAFRSIAIDLFPEDDAFCYSEGSCEKNRPMEKHLYACMGGLALTHNFSWSRWNLLSGSRTAVLLYRELIENQKVPSQSTLYVTPLKACIIDCTEVSTSFSISGVPGMNYYADLYHLALAHSKTESLEKHERMCPILRDTVIQVLKATRPLSFC